MGHLTETEAREYWGSSPLLVCSCGQGAKEFTIDGSRGIVNKAKCEVVVALDWTCLRGHRHFDWLPEDDAYALAREATASSTERKPE